MRAIFQQNTVYTNTGQREPVKNNRVKTHTCLYENNFEIKKKIKTDMISITITYKGSFVKRFLSLDLYKTLCV